MQIIRPENMKSHFDVARAFGADATEMLANLSSRYRGKILGMKPGGEVLEPEFETSFDVPDALFRDSVRVKQLGGNPFFGHGGGKQIGKAINAAIKAGRTDIYSEQKDGLRIVNEAGLEISRKVGSALRRSIADKITKIGASSGIRGVEVSGADIVTGFPIYEGVRTGTLDFERFVKVQDYAGLKAHVKKLVNVEFLRSIVEDRSCIPVIDWHCASANGGRLTLNADEMFVGLCIALEAERAIFLSCDKNGKYRGVHDEGDNLISKMTAAEARGLINDGTAKEGMAVKLENAIAAVKCGVKGVATIDPAWQGALMQELGAKEGAGTLIVDEACTSQDAVYTPKAFPADMKPIF